MAAEHLSTSSSRPASRRGDRSAVTVSAVILIALIWFVDTTHYWAGAIGATAVVLLVVILAFKTIGERERYEVDAAEGERRLLIAQMIGDMGEWSYDPSRNIVRLSPMLSWLYGLGGRRETTLAEARLHIAPEEQQLGDDAYRDVMATGESRQYQRVAKLADGTQRLRRVIVYPTRNAEGAIVGFHGIDQDITTAKRLESLESRILDLSRLDAMNLMAATLAHEINQPLTAAANYLAASRRMLAKTDPGPDPKIVDMIRSGETQVFNAGEIVRRVRQMVLKQDEHAPVTIVDAWNKAVQLIGAASPTKTVLFETDIDPDAAVAIADAVQLSQVFTNLMRNAIDAVHDGAAVIGLMTRLDGVGFVRLSVRDNGGGIAVPDRDFFALLAATKKGGAGLGLGLVISRTIVESHGGKIWVDSTGPEGTVVAFTLPVSPA